MKELSKEQEKLIEKYFGEVEKSEEFRKDMEEREKHRKLVVKTLNQNNLKNMTEIEFGELISSLWASRLWGNKDYLVQRTLDWSGGIDKIKSQLYDLLYGQDSFEKRFDRLMSSKMGLGPASITEILCLFAPDKFSIWNDKAREALKRLKFDNLPWVDKYAISGKEYQEVNEVMWLIAKKLEKLGLKHADLLMVDYFLWQVSGKVETLQAETFEWDHDEVRDFIEEIGRQLGFEAETEKLIATGAKVDVVWTAKIANLGVVTYVFEVHKTGSIDSLILNLQKALNNSTVQKIIAVSDKTQIEKIRNEIKALSESFRKSLTFWEASDVIETRQKLSEVMQSISRLELVKSQFGED